MSQCTEIGHYSDLLTCVGRALTALEIYIGYDKSDH